MTLRVKKRLCFIAGVTSLLIGVITFELPLIGAALILHPIHRAVSPTPPMGCQNVTFQGEGVILMGWQGHADNQPLGTLVYLHGVSDCRASAGSMLEHFRLRGFDVVAYDSRAHGESGGDMATYGFFEKQDLHRVLDTVRPGPIILVGCSLGAAVALQEAADDPRITAVVAAEAFSDLRTVVTERAPFCFTAGTIRKSIQLAEERGKFQFDAVSPELAARKINVPVLIIHGENDKDTPPQHSRRIYSALAGPKRLILVPGAGHCESLNASVWQEIETWLDSVIR
jgi:uncharacterized protein